MDETKQEIPQVSLLQIILFFVLAFVLTWSMFIPAAKLLPKDNQTLLIIMGAFGPFAAAMIVIWISKGRTELWNWLRQIFQFRVPFVDYLAGAFFLPIGIGVLQYLLYNVLGGEADFSDAIPWYFYLVALIPTAMLRGGNEEPGWRRFASPALIEWVDPIVAGFRVGLGNNRLDFDERKTWLS